MNKHDWVIGLLSEIEQYCKEHKLRDAATLISDAIQVASGEIEMTEAGDNIVYISDYLDSKILEDRFRIVLAFSDKLNEIV